MIRLSKYVFIYLLDFVNVVGFLVSFLLEDLKMKKHS
jgi:hypothetical protein